MPKSTGQRKRYDPETDDKIVELRLQGKKLDEIATILSVPPYKNTQ